MNFWQTNYILKKRGLDEFDRKRYYLVGTIGSIFAIIILALFWILSTTGF